MNDFSKYTTLRFPDIKRHKQFLEDINIKIFHHRMSIIYSISVPTVLIRKNNKIEMFYDEHTMEEVNKIKNELLEYISNNYKDLILNDQNEV